MGEVVFLDLDDVVANFVDAACAVHRVHCPYLDTVNHGEWAMHKLMGLTVEEFVRPMDFKFWLNLEKMPDAKIIVNFAKELKLPIYFLSAPVPTRGCRDGKHAWVRKHYAGYKLILCDSDTKSALAHAGAWLIDDRDSNVAEFRANGGKGILVPRPWNKLHLHSVSTAQTLKSMRMQVRMYDEGKL